MAARMFHGVQTTVHQRLRTEKRGGQIRSTPSRFRPLPTTPFAPPPESNQQTPHRVRHPARQRKENPEERKDDREDGENDNHCRRVRGNQRKGLHVNSPESTRPCHACAENWNGTLDIAASGWERNAPRVHGAPVWQRVGEHSHRAARDATERAMRPLFDFEQTTLYRRIVF